MKILVLGGGPGGLYAAILLKKAHPDHDITVIERNPRGVSFGWGVVFSDETLSYLGEADVETEREIADTFAHWDAIDTHYRGTLTRSVGHGFSGIARRRLIDILENRAEALGVTLEWERELNTISSFSSYDLVVAADGVNSMVRRADEAAFRPVIDHGRSKFIWLGTRKLFDAFTFIFEETAHGWFQVHSYRFDGDTSTFIVETDESTWQKAGFGEIEVEASIAELEKTFAPYLGGHPLLSSRSMWLNFPTLRCASWHHDNVVLVGDAAHTGHYSIGSGTKMAMEDAITLVQALEGEADLQKAFERYEADRRPVIARIQHAADISRHWFETVPRHTRHEPLQFNFSLLTRSKKITYDNLKLRDPDLVANVARDFAAKASVAVTETTAPPQPVFTPFRLRSLDVCNRIVVSPMCMYSAVDGTAGDFHLVHLGSRAIGGAGLIFTEMTNVAADGRISPACAGMYKPEHVAAWRRIVDFVHTHSRARIGMQLGHAGRKGSTQRAWEEMDAPLTDGNWPIIGPSPIPWSERNQTPREMDRADMERVRDEHVRATEMCAEAGFDIIELHMAHGYLLASFLSPLTNHRTDQHGGSLANRMRFPLEVFDAVRAAWPDDKPISVRLSATDWIDGGTSGDDAVVVAQALKDHGLDIVDVSSGGTTPEAHPEFYGRFFNAPFSDQIRNTVGIPTITVGNVQNVDHANTLLAAGRADLCALARPHLADPYFTLHAAAVAGADAGADEQTWPDQYLAAAPDRRAPE